MGPSSVGRVIGLDLWLSGFLWFLLRCQILWAVGASLFCGLGGLQGCDRLVDGLFGGVTREAVLDCCSYRLLARSLGLPFVILWGLTLVRAAAWSAGVIYAGAAAKERSSCGCPREVLHLRSLQFCFGPWLRG